MDSTAQDSGSIRILKKDNTSGTNLLTGVEYNYDEVISYGGYHGNRSYDRLGWRVDVNSSGNLIIAVQKALSDSGTWDGDDIGFLFISSSLVITTMKQFILVQQMLDN